jgi:hypothetical protein
VTHAANHFLASMSAGDSDLLRSHLSPELPLHPRRLRILELEPRRAPVARLRAPHAEDAVNVARPTYTGDDVPSAVS